MLRNPSDRAQMGRAARAKHRTSQATPTTSPLHRVMTCAAPCDDPRRTSLCRLSSPPAVSLPPARRSGDGGATAWPFAFGDRAPPPPPAAAAARGVAGVRAYSKVGVSGAARVRRPGRETHLASSWLGQEGKIVLTFSFQMCSTMLEH
jgi:hypothetical protein